MTKIWGLIGVLCIGNLGWSNNFDFPVDAQVIVTYLIRSSERNGWTTGTTTLCGIMSESMARNQIGSKHPGREVRVLGIQYRIRKDFLVKYQYRNRNSNSWTTGTSILPNVLTESMAINRLSIKYPNCEIKILSIVLQR